MKKVSGPENIMLEQLRVDESYWGEGAERKVLDWLVNNYDRQTMPPLVVNRQADGFFYIIGWENKGTKHDSLLHTVFDDDKPLYFFDSLELQNGNGERR